MDRTILAGIRVKTFVKSEGIGFNEQADGQSHWGHTRCVYEKISDGQAGTDRVFSINYNGIYYATSLLST